MAKFADTILDLSEPGPRAATTDDPDGALAAATGVVLIDEWQESEEILGAVKRAVDKDENNTPGKFIITGSVRAAQQGDTWPGTGRFVRVRMYGLTQAEMAGDPMYNPVDAFFGLTAPAFGISGMGRSDYLKRIVAGRFPSVVGLSERGRSRWFGSYVDQLIERDAPQVSSSKPEPGRLRSVLDSCVARTGMELNRQATARDAGGTGPTADRYLELLETLSIIARVGAWHSTRLHRINKSPKVHVLDTGLAADLLDLDAVSLGMDPALVGQFFESFVATELIAHLETASKRTGIHHLRQKDGKEVDIVLERAGRVVGLEVKSATSVKSSDAGGLKWLRDKLGDGFHYGAVLYAGTIPYMIDDRIWALPISCLWERPSAGD